MSIASGASKRRITAGSRWPGRWRCSAPSGASTLRLSQRTNVCSHEGRTDGRARSAGPGEQRLGARQRLARGAADLDYHELTRRGDPVEVHDLVVPRPAPQPGRVGAGRALDEDLELPVDEPLRAPARPPLHDLDEP